MFQKKGGLTRKVWREKREGGRIWPSRKLWILVSCQNILIISLCIFFCIWFVLPFVGHHLYAVLMSNSLDKVVSFEFLAGTISSSVCVCGCVFPYLYTPTPYEFVYIIFLLLGSSTFWLLFFSPLILFLLEIMAKYGQAVKPLNVMVDSEDPSKKDRKCLRSANGTRNSSRMQIC